MLRFEQGFLPKLSLYFHHMYCLQALWLSSRSVSVRELCQWCSTHCILLKFYSPCLHITVLYPLSVQYWIPGTRKWSTCCILQNPSCFLEHCSIHRQRKIQIDGSAAKTPVTKLYNLDFISGLQSHSRRESTPVSYPLTSTLTPRLMHLCAYIHTYIHIST